jgi:predicted acyltransferase
MLLMMAEVLELRRVAEALANAAPLWNFLAYHQTHVAWEGCSLHDLIQPSFSFLVGAALPFSLAARRAKGQSFGWMTWHAAVRSVVLTFMGIFLRSVGRPQTNFTFDDTLTQIGLGYLPLYFLGFVRQRWAVVACIAILVGYWAAFALYPAPPASFDYAAVGVPGDWQHHYTGLAAHWNKNSNLAWAADRWFLNLLPRATPFEFHGGGYATLNFIPTLATMILGLIAGRWLRGELSPWRKVGLLAIAGIVTMALGLAADWTGICPIVKRIWTPSWVLYSGGWCFFLLAAFYAVCDAAGLKAWSYPLRVVGANSIFAYLLAHVGHAYVVSALQTHLGEGPFRWAGEAYEPLILGLSVLLVWWLLLWWMYRQRLLVKI